jgi:hypothetical protein
MLKILSLLMLTSVLSLAVSAQSKLTENTLKLDEGSKATAAKIAEFEWLSGTWSGSGLGGTIEEIWSKPQNGAMMGMFRLFSGGKLSFYEFITLEERDGGMVMRLKHFDPNFVGWEEKDKTVDFPFIKKDGQRYHFRGLTFELKGESMDVFLAMRSKDGTYREAKFDYKRVKAGK